MGGNSDMPEVSYDSRIDYYEVLGVGREATGEELKHSHVELALKYHPDVAVGGDTAANNSHFRAIQDAFTVLGNPVTRQLYDDARYGSSSSSSILGGMGTSSSSSSAVPDNSYTMQKANYVNVRRNASSNWREIKDKYKTER
jgi:DnaJ-class molecular chaperone